MRLPAIALIMVTELLGACSPAGPTPPPEPGAVIEVASELPLADPGMKNAERAVEAAIAEHSTLRGYHLVYVSLDDSLAGKFDADKALQNGKRMLRDPRILGVIGPFNSATAMFVVPVTGQDHLVMISPSATADCLTSRRAACFTGPAAQATAANFFRIAARDSIAARAAADLAIRLGIRRFAVIGLDDPYSRPEREAFRSEFEHAGGTVVFSTIYSPTDTSYAPLLRNAHDAGAEAVYMASASFLGACRVRAAMNGIFPVDAYFISTDAIADAPCIRDAGNTANEHLVAPISAREPGTVPAVLSGLPRGHSYDAYNFAAYDCTEILIAAIDSAISDNRGKVPTPEQVLSEVAAAKDFKGITGTFSFDANGDAINPAVSFYYVHGGSWTFWQNAP